MAPATRSTAAWPGWNTALTPFARRSPKDPRHARCPAALRARAHYAQANRWLADFPGVVACQQGGKVAFAACLRALELARHQLVVRGPGNRAEDADRGVREVARD